MTDFPIKRTERTELLLIYPHRDKKSKTSPKPPKAEVASTSIDSTRLDLPTANPLLTLLQALNDTTPMCQLTPIDPQLCERIVHPHIFQHILTHLPRETITSLLQVNHSMLHQAVKFLFQRLRISCRQLATKTGPLSVDPNQPDNIHLKNDMLRHVRHVSLCCYCFGGGNLCSIDFTHPAIRLPSVTTLNISIIGQAHPFSSDIFTTMPNVQNLIIRASHISDIIGIFQSKASGDPVPLPSHIKNLTLDFSIYRHLNDDELQKELILDHFFPKDSLQSIDLVFRPCSVLDHFFFLGGYPSSSPGESNAIKLARDIHVLNRYLGKKLRIVVDCGFSAWYNCKTRFPRFGDDGIKTFVENMKEMWKKELEGVCEDWDKEINVVEYKEWVLSRD